MFPARTAAEPAPGSRSESGSHARPSPQGLSAAPFDAAFREMSYRFVAGYTNKPLNTRSGVNVAVPVAGVVSEHTNKP